MIGKILYNIMLFAEAIIFAWVFLSFIDFWHHDLARDLDLWLGDANLVYIVCTMAQSK